jgi:hypothetical protein
LSRCARSWLRADPGINVAHRHATGIPLFMPWLIHGYRSHHHD